MRRGQTMGRRGHKEDPLYRGRKLLQKSLQHYAHDMGIVHEQAGNPADLEAFRRRRSGKQH